MTDESFSRINTSSSEVSVFFAACGPAELSRHAPRALNSVSSQRGVILAGGIEATGGASGRPKATGEIIHATTSYPAGPSTRNAPFVVGTTYSRLAAIRLFDPVSTRGKRSELVDEVLWFVT